jgi:Right handed beta helix region
VSPDGSDRSGDGSPNRPWASLLHATNTVPDEGCEIVFLDGLYGPQDIRRTCRRRVTIRAQNSYRACWASSAARHRVFFAYGAGNFTVSGFEMRGAPGSEVEYLVQITLPESHDILLENNVIHDGYVNDLIKVNDGAHHVVIRGNVFYNQPRVGDEHLDINTVHDITIENNVFFNDFAASGRPVTNATHPFVLIKNSGATPTSRDFIVRGNVFLNWQGTSDQPYLLLGEDAKPFHEARNVLVENNLFLGNTANRMTAAFAIKGVRDVVFRANTIHGDFPLGSDSWGFAMRLGREGENPKNENIAFYNNVWSDPTGTMTHLSAGDAANTSGAVLRNNLYFNGGKRVPVDRGRVLNTTDDPRAVVADPGLPADLASIVPPTWRPSAGRFADGSRTIEEARRRLVQRYGTPKAGSPVVNAADPRQAPSVDILNRPRGPKPDLGAVEVRP